MNKEIPCDLFNNELILAIGINLQVEIHDVMFRIPATIVGFISDQCILITIPFAKRKRVANKILRRQQDRRTLRPRGFRSLVLNLSSLAISPRP